MARHLGYVIVPVVADDGKTPILPDLRNSWGYPGNEKGDSFYAVIWTSRAGATKARRKIFGKQYKTMRVCRIRLGE